MKQEIVAVRNRMETYYRYMAGKAGKQEMGYDNAEFCNFLKTLSLDALIIISGSFITIPLVMGIAKSRGIDIFPKSRLNRKEISGAIDDR